ncbi:hypothetical protein M5K25_028494 [Dendrobium thyrsiflorum]|uniref:Uncharacterized protein n=1 Tax=Dendrobium thyrsiflorum TaxID=117978 RepID=A0ABD0TT00_DENTH
MQNAEGKNLWIRIVGLRSSFSTNYLAGSQESLYSQQVANLVAELENVRKIHANMNIQILDELWRLREQIDKNEHAPTSAEQERGYQIPLRWSVSGKFAAEISSHTSIRRSSINVSDGNSVINCGGFAATNPPKFVTELLKSADNKRFLICKLLLSLATHPHRSNPTLTIAKLIAHSSPKLQRSGTAAARRATEKAIVRSGSSESASLEIMGIKNKHVGSKVQMGIVQ